MQRALLLLIAGCRLGFAPVPFPKPGPKCPELKALQGESPSLTVAECRPTRPEARTENAVPASVRRALLLQSS
jgi:hypothetical protein